MARSSILSVSSRVSFLSSQPSLRMLYCHYVFDNQVEAFEKIIAQLSRVGTFINSEKVERIAKGQDPLNKTYFHLSFDDGFKNIRANALPILRKYNVPSTFFVPSAFIGANFETVEHYCVNLAGYPQAIEMCTWDDLKSAAEIGMEIGSHTRHHRRFSEMSLDNDVMDEEIAGSRDEIERHLGLPCKTISWPYGRREDSDEVSRRFAGDAGYTLCFGAFRGRVKPGVSDLLCLPRHHFEPQWPLRHIEYFARGGMERD